MKTYRKPTSKSVELEDELMDMIPGSPNSTIDDDQRAKRNNLIIIDDEEDL